MSTSLGVHLNRGSGGSLPLKSHVQQDANWDFSTLKLTWRDEGCAESEVCFYLPKDPDDQLARIIAGILVDRPGLRERFFNASDCEFHGAGTCEYGCF